LLFQQVLRYRQLVPGMSGDLEFPLLLAAYAELLPDALDPANTYPDTMLRQVVLQLLRAVGLPGAPVRRSNLKLQAYLFTGPLR